ncbi:cysteine desulfurase family protein [Herbiconiux flava]|uniref:Cysteine desulfurase n=1 Tax=Herbiconiux flava TaxID=881268 RepID=A0A852SL66_9MICO|nr:cysteine desulfurase family protein [Herbiconiux flava]NYD69451.1 cysteine desulfurase [Herbiconiux flava]GLK16196.1 cysteine desulfurase [Herbiconiux flava]
MIHLDAAATTPVRREVLEAMWPHLTGEFGNPSSHHALGDAAARALAGARRTVAEWFGCRPAEVVFTSGGTEGANLAVKGLALGSPRGRHAVLSAVEHPAVVESVDHLRRLHGFDVTVVPVDGTGLVDPAAFADALRADTTLATVMLANNEIGTVQPVAELAAVAHERGVPFHTDAVQAAGWLDLRLDVLGADAVSISGHKLGAPKGIGAVAVRGRHPLEPVLHGGGQERGRRSGTENVAFAVGLARAVELAEPARTDAAARTTALRDDFIVEVLRRVDGAVLTGHPDARLPSVASFCFPGTSGEAVLLGLEERGVIVSSGSACAAGSDDPSPVLLALGLDPAVAQTAVRFTFTPATTAPDLAAAATALEATLASLATLR